MNEFAVFLKDNLPMIISILSGLQVLIGLVFGLVEVRIHHSMKRLRQAAEARRTFTVCPHCGKEVPLSNIDFRLPDGSIDNDLNGVPDDKERS